jgi:DNA-binding Xre family transcriptional regulator
MPTRSKYDPGKGGTMYVTLRSYIERLSALENSKPKDQRRHVPTMKELAEEVGIHQVTMSEISNSNIRQLNLETGGRIIAAMRRRGFSMDVNDLLAYREAEEV